MKHSITKWKRSIKQKIIRKLEYEKQKKESNEKKFTYLGDKEFVETKEWAKRVLIWCLIYIDI